MLRYFFFLLVSLSLSLPGQAQTLSVRWDHAYGSADDDEGGYAVAMPGGGYVLAGHRYTLRYSTTAPTSLLYFVRTDAQGDTLWTRYYTPPNTVEPVVTGMVSDAAGNLVVTGGDNTQAHQGFVLKLMPTASTLVPIWALAIPTGFAGSTGVGVFNPVVTSDGNYVVTYFERNDPTISSQPYRYDAYLMKIDSQTSNLIWSYNFTPYFLNLGYTYAGFEGLVATANGVFALVGAAQGSTTVRGSMLVDANGAVTRLKLDPNTTLDSFPAIFTNGSNVFVARQQMVTKLTFAGDTVWHTVIPPRYPNRQWDASSIAQDSRGNIVVLATSVETVLDDYQCHLARLSAGGTLLTDTMLYRAPDNIGRTLLLAANDEPVISGYTTSGLYGGSDLFLVKFSAFSVLAIHPAATVALAAGLSCYPNPAAASAEVRAVLPAPAVAGSQLSLYDGLGRRCVEVAVAAGASEAAVLVAGLVPGLYVLRLRLPDGRDYATKLVRE